MMILGCGLVDAAHRFEVMTAMPPAEGCPRRMAKSATLAPQKNEGLIDASG